MIMGDVAPHDVAPRSQFVSRRTLLAAAAIIAIGNVLSRGLGLVREQVIAATFGATASTDAYIVARTVPLILYDLLVGTVITAAFVPVFVQFAHDEKQLWRVVGIVVTLAALAFGAVALALALGADAVVNGLVNGSQWTPEQRGLAGSLLRVALVSVVFQGLAGVLTSVLYAQNRFTLPAFATATYNAGIIVSVVLLGRFIGVEAAAIGLVIGAIGQFALQCAGLPGFIRAYRPRIDLSDPSVRRILRLYSTVAVGMLVTITGQIIDRNLAARLTQGSISSMQYATTIIQFPLGMVGLAASYAILPTLARFAGGPAQSSQGYREALLFGFKIILLLMIPALVGLTVLSSPVVQVLFQHGAFGPDDTTRTAGIFLAYAPQLPFTAIDYLLINAFYARQNIRTPVIVGAVCVGLYLVTALLLLRPLGAPGLALANAVQNSSHALILLVLLRRAVPNLRIVSSLLPFLLRTVPAALLMGVAVWAAWPVFSHLGGLPGLIVTVAGGALVYGIAIQVLGVPESRAFVNIIRARLAR